tara:strand:- start:1429 stop:5790 length:4362 start_codon:yes stop_codon:yes gene_type:complete
MANIQIYADITDASIHFDGSTVSTKPLNTVEAIAHPTLVNRVIIKSTVPKNNGFLKIYFRKCKISRIENKDGVELVATLGMDRTQVLAYLNAEFAKTLADGSSEYKGTWDASTNTPDLTASIYQAGDWYFVTNAGTYDGVVYGVNDQIRYNGTSFDKIEDTGVKVSEIEDAALSQYDAYVDPDFIGTSTGSTLKPWTTILDAVNNSNEGETISVKGVNIVSAEIVLPHGLSFYGVQHSEIKYASYDVSNGDILFYDGDNTKELEFNNIIFKNAGGYGLRIKKAAKVSIEDCTFINNGWNGTGLSTVLAEADGVLGYDSSATDLQAFYAGSNASNGGAMRIEEATQALIIGNTAKNNLRGFRVQDCGINGGGVISRNQSTQNIESGIYIAAGSLGGSQNITTTMNATSYNANNGLLVIGGINNKFSQNEVNGNWNAGFCAWGSSNVTLRDCGLYDNNRSEFNGIGNTGDAKASIQINDAYSFIATQITYNPDFRFIAEILDTQVHNTGLGSNTEKIGFLMTSGMGLIPDNNKNIVKVDDVGFIGQDYAIDLSEVNVDNLRLSLGDNSFQNIGEKAVKTPLGGKYYELPFSNHTTNINYADFSVDLTGSIIIKEGSTGNRMNPYKVNDLQAIANGAVIDIMLKDSNKIQFTVPVSGCSIDGTFVNSVLNQALVQLNGVFTNTVGFSSGGNPVASFALSGNDLTITLDDATSFTVDVTTLGVDEDKFVSSGAINGSDLDLTMNDASVVTIDMANMINGSSLTATNDKWFISYGTNANTEVGVSTNDSTINQQLPFYFGQALTQGSEFKWNFQSNGGSNLIMGIWDGAEVATAYNGGSITPSNWGTSFTYAGGFMDSSNSTLTNTTNGTKYVVGTGDALSIRFDDLGFLTLVDISVNPEVEIAKTTIPLAVTSFNMQMHTWANGVLPNGIISEKGWSIVHDFANIEAGIINGILDHTVIKSAVSIVAGEKIMFMLDEVGQGDFFGTNYTAASSGVSTAEEQLDNTFIYQTNEAIVFDTASGVSDWNANTNAPNYFYAASLNQYRDGGAGTIQGMFSLRFTDDGQLTIYDEDSGIKIATAKADPAVGSSVQLYFGVKGNRAYYSIPVVSKQAIGSGSQPSINFVPTIADQTVSVREAEVLNFQVVSSDNIVNQYVELDAPSWMTMNQVTGVLSGTAPAFAGTSADTIVVNCKAGNAVGGSVDFIVTVTVASYASTNTKSLKFPSSSNAYLNGNHALVPSLQRTGNGSGSSDAWSISMWVKPSTVTNAQTLFYFGGDDLVNEGRIEIQQFSGNNIVFRYGKNSNNTNYIGVGNFPTGQWNHILITYSGADTLIANGGATAFSMFINGVNGTSQLQQTGGGHSGNIPADKFRMGRLLGTTTNQYLSDGIINQAAIWGTDETANLATIYNSGATQDLSLLASAPAHYYEIESSVTTIADIIGNADLTGYNFVAGDLVTDAP